MPDYPVMFTVRDAVSGNGYLAGVTMSGRAVVCREDDGKWWVYGVRPGAIAEWGTTPLDAFHKFRDRYKTLLFDIAEEFHDFESFKREVEQFYNQPDPEEENRWVAAFQAIRSGSVEIEAPFTDLPKESPEKRPTGVFVQPLHQLKRFTASDNIQESTELAAAA
jgi:hypothetical protein